MKFMKGVIFGTVISAGAIMLYNETTKNGKNKAIMKKGKKFMKSMGII